MRPVLSTFTITPDVRKAIEDKVMHALFRSLDELPPRETLRGIPLLTVSQAKERLAMAGPEFQDAVDLAVPVPWCEFFSSRQDLSSEPASSREFVPVFPPRFPALGISVVPSLPAIRPHADRPRNGVRGRPRSKRRPVDCKQLGFSAWEMGSILHEWLDEAAVFFRSEGADSIREGLRKRSRKALSDFVWSRLFDQRIVSLAQRSGMLQDESSIRLCDLAVESLKLWTRHICEHLHGIAPEDLDPAAFFLDSETTLEAELLHNGRRIALRGRPDAVFFDPRVSELHVWEYKFGRQGQWELQIAQVLLYMALIEAAKGCRCARGHLTLFKLVEKRSSNLF